MMKFVYANAMFTIAAAGAKDSTGGLFVKRKPQSIVAPMVESSWTKLSNNQWCMVDERLWMREVDYSPLSKRAWVVQERFLSPRTLFFTTSQIFYECCESTLCETFPIARPPHQVGLSAKKIGQSGASPIEIWNTAASAYSEAALSKDTDKVIAIAGIAERMQEILKDEYFVGFWKRDFLAQLVWENPRAEKLRPSPILVPSWSWLSIHGSLRLTQLYNLIKPLVEVVDINVDLVDPNYPFGNVKYATLRLKGMLKEAWWDQKNRYGRSDFRRYQISYDGAELSTSERDIDLNFFTHVDVIPTQELLSSPIFILPICFIQYKNSNDRQTRGLVLVQKDADSRQFERVGTFAIDPKAMSGLSLRRQREGSWNRSAQDPGLLEQVMQFLSLTETIKEGWEEIPSAELTIL
jgi:Heterokaryon incompatibility protein (HET)